MQPSRQRFLLRIVLLAALLAPLTASAAALKINGSTTVNLPVAEAAEILRAERKMQIHVDTQGGSSGGISMLGDGQVHIGMTSKHVSDDDRAKFPKVQFHETRIGEDAVALIVSKDVWESGVRALNKQQVRAIYESKITHWNQLGGPNRRVVFFNKEPGRGTWEVFAHWLYGDSHKAPPVSFPEVGGNEEARNKVASTRGAISQLSASWADGKSVFALGLRSDSGEIILPAAATIANHSYPMSRPLFVLTPGEPAGPAKTFIDFLLSPRGQSLVRKHGYLSIDELNESNSK